MTKIVEIVSKISVVQSISGIEAASVEIKEIEQKRGNTIGDTERGKINKFKGTTVFSRGRGGYSFIPAGGKCKTAGCYQSTKGGSAAVHAEDTLATFFVESTHFWLVLGFVSPRFSQWIHSSTWDVRAFSLFRYIYLFVDFSACECRERTVRKCRRCTTEMHWQAGVALWEYVCEQSEYYACKKYAGDKNRGCQAEFSKIPIQEGIFMIALLSTIRKWFAIAATIFTSFLFY